MIFKIMINFNVEDFKDLVSDMNKVIGSTVSFKRHVDIHDAFNTTWIKLSSEFENVLNIFNYEHHINEL